jgi:hypothetical protein
MTSTSTSGWKESGWFGPIAKRGKRPAGVRIDRDTSDEYVVMRFAELVEGGLVTATIDRALAEHHGNAGCEALTRSGPRLQAALARLTASSDV